MRPDPKKLAELTLAARILRDRDLAAVAAALRRLKTADADLANLRDRAAETAAAFGSASDLNDLKQLHAYRSLLDQQEAHLERTRAAVAARAENDLARARLSSARWQVTEELERTGYAAWQKQRAARG